MKLYDIDKNIFLDSYIVNTVNTNDKINNKEEKEYSKNNNENNDNNQLEFIKIVNELLDKHIN